MHHIDRRLASYSAPNAAPNLARYLRLTLPTQQDEHRTAPFPHRSVGHRARPPPRRRDDRIELGRAAVVQLHGRIRETRTAAHRIVQVPSGASSARRPGGVRSPYDMERAERSGSGNAALEARQPGRRPAREPTELRQLQLGRATALQHSARRSLSAPRELASQPRVHEQQASTDRDVRTAATRTRAAAPDPAAQAPALI